MKFLAFLLLFVPAAIIAEYMHAGPILVVSLSAAAIIPLSGYLGKATEEIAGQAGCRDIAALCGKLARYSTWTSGPNS